MGDTVKAAVHLDAHDYRRIKALGVLTLAREDVRGVEGPEILHVRSLMG